MNAFAKDLSHPRWLYVLPNGDVLVAETDTPPKPEDSNGVQGKVYKTVQEHAGSGKSPSANRITLLRDTTGDGIADLRTVFISGLNSPFGMALVGNSLIQASANGLTLAQLLARHPGTARRTAQRWIQQLIREGKVRAAGQGRARRYLREFRFWLCLIAAFAGGFKRGLKLLEHRTRGRGLPQMQAA